MSDSQVVPNSGVGFFGLLTILFIGLKLTNFITWSWWLVLAPVWIPMVILLVVVLVGLIWYLTLGGK